MFKTPRILNECTVHLPCEAFIYYIDKFPVSFSSVKPYKEFRIEGFAQGTTYQLTYYAADSLVSPAEVEAVLSKLDSSLSLYKPYSIINAFNQSTTGIAIDKHLENVVTKSLEIYAATGGAFDITVWPLVNAWRDLA